MSVDKIESRTIARNMVYSVLTQMLKAEQGITLPELLVSLGLADSVEKCLTVQLLAHFGLMEALPGQELYGWPVLMITDYGRRVQQDWSLSDRIATATSAGVTVDGLLLAVRTAQDAHEAALALAMPNGNR